MTSSLPDGTVVAARRDGDAWILTVNGDRVGSIEHGRVELGSLVAELESAGTRRVLTIGGRSRALRLDQAGGKASWLALSSGRYRLARQRSRPLQRRWELTHDVIGTPLLTVTQTPMGIRLRVEALGSLDPRAVELLVAGAFVEILEVAAGGVAAAA